MLKNWLITVQVIRFFQSGCYIDFILKKISEVFIRNTLIYASQFIGEKYLIEVLTKKSVDMLLFTVNKFTAWERLYVSTFFLQVSSLILYGAAGFLIFFVIN